MFNKYLVWDRKGEASKAWHEGKLMVLPKKKERERMKVCSRDQSGKWKGWAVKRGDLDLYQNRKSKIRVVDLTSRVCRNLGTGIRLLI